MPKVCKEIFERTVVHTQHKIIEEDVNHYTGRSVFISKKGKLKVSYEDKLIEIKMLNSYSNLELTLNTNIYKDGVIVGKVYKIELDSEGDVLYFLEPEYRLAQPDDTYKEYLRMVKDVNYCYEIDKKFDEVKNKLESKTKEVDNKIEKYEVETNGFKNTIKEKNVRIESLEKGLAEKIIEVKSLNEGYKIIESKNNEIEILKEKVESIRNNIIDEIKTIMKNTTIIERLSISKFVSTLEELKL